MKKIPTDKRLKQIDELAPLCKNKTDFWSKHPYLYIWANKHNVDISKYFPRKPIHCHLYDRVNNGIDVYKFGSKKLYKHYAFIIDALRELDLSYYYVNRVLEGKIPHINGYVFVKNGRKE